MRIWFLWFKHRWQGVTALGITLLAILVVILMLLNTSTFGMTFLGNASAPRPALGGGPSGTILPRSGDGTQAHSTLPDQNSSLFDAPVAADAGPQTIAEAQAPWSAAELQQHQAELLAGLNCARRQQKLPILTLDPQLSQTAGDAWLKLTRDQSFSLMSLPGQYTMRSVLPLNFGTPNLATSSQSAGPGDVSSPACPIAGFDAATLPAVSSGSQIGIAVFPPQASWDMASAVVLVK